MLWLQGPISSSCLHWWGWRAYQRFIPKNRQGLLFSSSKSCITIKIKWFLWNSSEFRPGTVHRPFLELTKVNRLKFDECPAHYYIVKPSFESSIPSKKPKFIKTHEWQTISMTKESGTSWGIFPVGMEKMIFPLFL